MAHAPDALPGPNRAPKQQVDDLRRRVASLTQLNTYHGRLLTELIRTLLAEGILTGEQINAMQERTSSDTSTDA